MSCRATKFHRREIRKAVGQDALDTLSETQQNIQALANSVALAHSRLDTSETLERQHDATIARLQSDLMALSQFVLLPKPSFWTRLFG